MYLIGHLCFTQSPNKKKTKHKNSKETFLLLVYHLALNTTFKSTFLSTYMKRFVLRFLNLCQRVGHTKKKKGP